MKYNELYLDPGHSWIVFLFFLFFFTEHFKNLHSYVLKFKSTFFVNIYVSPWES